MLFERFNRMDVRHLNSRKEARQMLMIWSCMESPVYFISEVYLTDVLKVILLPPMSAESLSTSLRRDEVTTAITSVLSAFSMSLLLFVHDKTSSVHVWMPGWTERNSSGGALCIISIVKVSLMIRHYIRQRLGVQCEQDRSQNSTLGDSIHMGARSRHNTINNDRLTAIMDIESRATSRTRKVTLHIHV